MDYIRSLALCFVIGPDIDFSQKPQSDKLSAADYREKGYVKQWIPGYIHVHKELHHNYREGAEAAKSQHQEANPPENPHGSSVEGEQ